MIAEDVLERGLQDAAAEFDVPEGAVDRLRDRLVPEADGHEVPRVARLVRSRRAWLVATAAGVVLLVVAAMAIGNVSSRTSHIDTFGEAKAPGSLTPVPAGGAGESGDASSSASGTVAGPAPAPVLGSFGGSRSAGKTPSLAPGDSTSKVVKTGEMDLQADKGKVSAVLNRLYGIATLERGYIADSHSSEGNDPSGEVTLRVPAQAFEATLGQVRNIGAKVLSQQTSGEDVTASYVDLQARIRALTATRATFERLLSKATTIGDILAVQSRITDVQTQIEQLQGQLRVLSDKADFAALTVTVDQRVAPAPEKHQQSGLSKAFHRSVDRFLGGIEAIIGILGPLLLAVLLVGLFVVAGRLGYRRLRRQLV